MIFGLYKNMNKSFVYVNHKTHMIFMFMSCEAIYSMYNLKAELIYGAYGTPGNTL